MEVNLNTAHKYLSKLKTHQNSQKRHSQHQDMVVQNNQINLIEF